MSNLLDFFINSPENDLDKSISSNYNITLKRDDLIHSIISGNKYRKLKYNILEAQNLGLDTLLTFGGAFSNHIAATAAVSKMVGLKSIGIIRGKELEYKYENNPTLVYAEKCGMHLHFVSREEYKVKTSEEYINQLKNKLGNFYLLPEGGTNGLAVKGCTEIIDASHDKYDYLCCAVGTGGTLAGIIEASKPHQKIIGFSALKGTFQNLEIEKFTEKRNFEIIDDYCFGGYAKIDSTLVRFINEFKNTHNIPLDPIYTGKMMFGIADLMTKNYFAAKSKILAIHTGGLQGIAGINNILKNKNLERIHV